MQIAFERRLIKTSVYAICDQIYAVNAWKNWNSRIEKIELLESPKPGAMGRIKIKNSGVVHFTLLEVDPRKLLKWSTRWFWVEVIYSYRLIPNFDGTIVVFEAECQGSFPKLARWFLENDIYRHLEEALNGLKAKLDPQQKRALDSVGEAQSHNAGVA